MMSNEAETRIIIPEEIARQEVESIVATIEDTIEARGLEDQPLFGVELARVLIDYLANSNTRPHEIKTIWGDTKRQKLLNHMDSRTATQYLDSVPDTWDEIRTYALALQHVIDLNIQS